jgi:hypothetical protein
MRRLLVAGAVGLLLVRATAACGDDGGDDASEVSIDAFCDEVSQYAEGGDFSDEATATAYEEMEAVAPDQIQGDITILREAIGTDVLGDERTAAAAERFTTYVGQACDVDLREGP